MSLTTNKREATGDASAFAYSICSGSPVLIGVIRLLRRLLKPVHRRATGLALRAIRPLKCRASVRLDDESLIRFILGDVYWNPFVWEQNFDYEPEIRHVLQRLRDIEYVFLDAGANIGYWSVLVSSKMLGGKKVIAVEASKETFALLQQNSEANGHRFHVHRNAIFGRDGERLSFSKGPHVARHVLSPGENGDEVESLTLDTLALRYNLSAGDSVVIKLDVEGAEEAALKGCHSLLQRDTLIIYEDHGNDKTHATSRFVLEELRLPVFATTDDGIISEISQLSSLDRIKTERFKGYNFLACPPGSRFHHWLIAQTETSARPVHALAEAV
jgi:FkbM family methyltransferase